MSRLDKRTSEERYWDAMCNSAADEVTPKPPSIFRDGDWYYLAPPTRGAQVHAAVMEGTRRHIEGEYHWNGLKGYLRAASQYAHRVPRGLHAAILDAWREQHDG